MTAEYRIYQNEYRTNGNVDSHQMMTYRDRPTAEGVAAMLNAVADREPRSEYRTVRVNYTVEMFQL